MLVIQLVRSSALSGGGGEQCGEGADEVGEGGHLGAGGGEGGEDLALLVGGGVGVGQQLSGRTLGGGRCLWWGGGRAWAGRVVVPGPFWGAAWGGLSVGAGAGCLDCSGSVSQARPPNPACGRVGRRRGPCVCRAFSVGPPPNRTCPI